MPWELHQQFPELPDGSRRGFLTLYIVSMIVAFWNVRGLGHEIQKAEVCSLVSTQKGQLWCGWKEFLVSFVYGAHIVDRRPLWDELEDKS